ncbi:MAG: Tex-like N-terminal domain-containing protein [Gemmataceae bacterium]
MHQAATSDFARIAQDLQIRKLQVESVVQLLDEGNTVPFLARYRKERTGGLPEDVLRHIQQRVAAHRQLGERKQSILKSIEARGQLTDELREAITAAETSKRLDDLYLPFKPKKKSSAAVAREKGLGELARAVWTNDAAVANFDEVLVSMIDPDKGLAIEDILSGVQHILAETIAETAAIRAAVRAVCNDSARLVTTRSETLADGQGAEFKDYFQFTESVRNLPPHRVLAINRGEKEGALKVKVEFDQNGARKVVQEKLPLEGHAHASLLQAVAVQALEQHIAPSLEREVRKDLTERAQQHAIGIFARNLRSLLLQPPLPGKRVLAVDPGFRNGCRLAALDEQGDLLGQATIYPHAPQNRKEEARVKLEELIRAHQLNVVAIGNGTACRETEELVADLIVAFEQKRNGVITTDAVAATPPAERPTEQASEEVAEAASAEAAAAESTEPPKDSSGEGSGAFPEEDKPPENVATPEEEKPAEPQTNVAVVSVPEAPVAEAAPAAETAESRPAEQAASAETAESPPAEQAAVSAETGEAAPTEAAAAPAPSGPTPAQKRAAREAALAEAKKALEGLPPPPAELAYLIVNEIGSRAYASSTLGREEFPDLDAPLRGTISIGRRLQDPLGELVKIDPPSMGVGVHQHDVNPRALREALEGVVESAVNHVGVDINTAGVAQ